MHAARRLRFRDCGVLRLVSAPEGQSLNSGKRPVPPSAQTSEHQCSPFIRSRAQPPRRVVVGHTPNTTSILARQPQACLCRREQPYKLPSVHRPKRSSYNTTARRPGQSIPAVLSLPVQVERMNVQIAMLQCNRGTVGKRYTTPQACINR